MRVLVTGIRGLVGSELRSRLVSAGHTVIGLSRSAAGDDFIRWDVKKGLLDLSSFAVPGNELDGVIHLAGESIAAGRWSEEVKRRIRESRLAGTSLLVNKIAELPVKPKVFISASAIGFYGDRGDSVLTEKSDAGTGFLAELCKDWEGVSDRLQVENTQMRVLKARLGVVLSTRGGALAKMLPPFRLGLGGPIGDGKQYMSWITLKDAASALVHLLLDEDVIGPVNLVSPEPVTNSEFAKALGRAVHRPALLPMPEFAARTVFGEMADELLLASTRVEPEALLNCGFQFSAPDIDSAFRQVLSS